MQYNKQHLSFESQAELLIRRGLVADKNILVERLKSVGYCRLSAYFYPYRITRADGSIAEDFRKGTTLDEVWRDYLFDRKLRLLLLDAIERIEVAFRVMIAYYHTAKGSPFDYASTTYFPKWQGYEETLDKVRVKQSRKHVATPDSKGGVDFIEHFAKKYGDTHEYLPLWIAVGILDFGDIIHFYTHSSKEIRKAIAHEWSMDPRSLRIWLTSLRRLRNDCAHHARVWNKTFVSEPNLDRYTALEWNYVYDESLDRWIRPRKEDTRPSLVRVRNRIAPLISAGKPL